MNNTQKTGYFNIKETAESLGVDTETLILWNENNILKPTITQTGEVGYREEQINQFIAIQQQMKNNQNLGQNPLRNDVSNTFSKGLIRTPFSFTTVLVFVLSLSATVISSTLILKSLANKSGGQEPLSASRISLLDPSGSAFIPLPTQQISNINSGQKDGGAAFNEILGSESAGILPKPDNNLSANTYSETVNIAKESPLTGVLAATTLTNGMNQSSSPVKQTADLNLLLVILALGSLSIPFIFKKQPAYLTTRSGRMSDIPTTDSQIALEEQKILEVNQKTDGTVVLCFQGQEYKVSKPELDSESDQFIERLMGLVKPGVKEIDYDAIGDGEIRLSAPLSKIVTRLGFVGVKRDLFFPRTSKNRVLFRKYLTRDDLVSMNLNPDQIKNEFVT